MEFGDDQQPPKLGTQEVKQIMDTFECIDAFIND
jgi:hypothetical protein